MYGMPLFLLLPWAAKVAEREKIAVRYGTHSYVTRLSLMVYTSQLTAR